MNAHFLRILAVAAFCYAAVFFAGKSVFMVIDYVKEHVMCMDPTLECPAKPQPVNQPDSMDLVSEAIACMDEARNYLELHSAAVRARIAELGVDIPPFSPNAPVLVELRTALARVAPVFGVEVRL